MKIEFDQEKAAANPIKHDGVTFEEAKAVLLDPFVLTHEDKNIVYEQRFISLGMGRTHFNCGVDITRRNSPHYFCMESKSTPKETL